MRRATPGALLVLAIGTAAAARAEVLSGVPVAGGDPNAVVDGWLACRAANSKAGDCPALRAAAIDVLSTDLRTLGAGGNFAPLPTLLAVLARSPEPELRAAAADGIGMLGPRPTETPALAAAFGEAVPAVRLSAKLALQASSDPVAQALASRAVGAERWQGFGPEGPPNLPQLGVPLYAGAVPLRFAIALAKGSAQLVSSDPVEKVVAFYAAKSKRQPLGLDEFAAAFSGQPAEEESGDAGGGMPSADDMARAMEMAMQMGQAMNEAMNAGKSMHEAAAELAGAATSADAAASDYANPAIYGSPRVVVLEESSVTGTRKPVRYVVVYRDLALGKTGIAVHAPPVL
jgi:hypothetical protein